MAQATALIQKFTTLIINPAILLVFAFAFLMFMVGLVEFMLNLENQTKRADGARHMMWGIIGILIMVAVRSIIVMLDNTFQLGAVSGTIDASRLNSINTTGSFFKP